MDKNYVCVETFHAHGIGMCIKGREVKIEKTKRREQRLEFGIRFSTSVEFLNKRDCWWMFLSRDQLERHFRLIES